MKDFDIFSIFLALNFSSHKSKRPVKSIGAAKIIAAGEAMDQEKVLANAYRVLLHIDFDLLIVLDSKDLFETLSTCRYFIDSSISADVGVIRYEFETHKLNRLTWVLSKLNLADPSTRPSSPLVQPLQLYRLWRTYTLA